MVVLDDIKARIKALKTKFDGCLEFFDPNKLTQRKKELALLQEDPELFKDVKRAQNINAEAKAVNDKLEDIKRKEALIKDADGYVELIEAENDESLVPELEELVESLEKDIETMHLTTLLRGEYDANNAILTLHAGAGGTEAQDWCQMLYRMYTRWAERKGFTIEELDFLDGDEAGVKSVTFQVNGENAYGYLKSEKGVHRLVRISPFNAAGKRQTSFVSCDVMPDIDKEIDVEVRDEDIRIDTYRSSGAGGQHINKTSSAIRITHMPTGIVVTCQNERSQFQNKDKALEILRSRLLAQKQKEQQDAINADRAGQVGTGDRSEKIRTYNFPQDRCTDHRIGLTVHNLDKIMDGNLDDIIDALATREQAEKLQKLNT